MGKAVMGYVRRVAGDDIPTRPMVIATIEDAAPVGVFAIGEHIPLAEAQALVRHSRRRHVSTTDVVPSILPSQGDGSRRDVNPVHGQLRDVGREKGVQQEGDATRPRAEVEHIQAVQRLGKKSAIEERR